MTWIATYFEKAKIKTHKYKRELLLECNQCKKQFLREWDLRYRKQPNHFCDHICSARFNTLLMFEDNIYVEKFSKVMKEVNNRPEMKLSRQETSLQMWQDEVKKTKILTGMEKNAKDPAYRLKLSNVQKIVQNRPEVKAKQVYIQKIVQNKPEVKERQRISQRIAQNKPEVRKKRRDTLKANFAKHKTKSKPEDNFFKYLSIHFNTERQIDFNNNKLIDFFLKELNLYIELDGIYWHGLNKELNIIKQNAEKENSKQAKVIYKKYLQDRILDQHFNDNKIKLVRITDKHFLSMNEQQINDFILNLKELANEEDKYVYYFGDEYNSLQHTRDTTSCS